MDVENVTIRMTHSEVVSPNYKKWALNFYKKFGFEIDEDETNCIVPFKLPYGSSIPLIVLYKDKSR